MDKVSIIMAAYNARDFIDTAIESVRRQTYQDWELVIVDDSSTDDTYDYLTKTYGQDERFKILKLDKNSGPAAARNKGILAATGDWITILDSDDAYLPERLERLLDHCHRDSLDMVCDNLLMFDANSNKDMRKGFMFPANEMGLTLDLFVSNDAPPLKFPFGLLQPYISTKYLRLSGVFYPENIRVGEDFDFIFRLLQKGARATLVNDAYYIYTLPHSPRTKQASGKSRTDYGRNNIVSLISSNQNLLLSSREAQGRGLNTIRLLERRGRAFLCSLAVMDIKRALSRRDYPQVLKTILSTRWSHFLFNKMINIVFRTQYVRGASVPCVKKHVRRAILASLRFVYRTVSTPLPFNGKGACLVIAPHADDETLGCASAIIQYREAGHAVFVVIVTDGRASSSSSVVPLSELVAKRQEETRAACAILGVEAGRVFFLSYPDRETENQIPQVAESLFDLINKINPTVILSPLGVDLHPDHRAVAKAIDTLVMQKHFQAAVYEYPIWFWPRLALKMMFNPMMMLCLRSVSTDTCTPRKRKALDAYSSQTVNITGEGNWWRLPPDFVESLMGPHEFFFEKRRP